jgi:hypothetical protein
MQAPSKWTIVNQDRMCKKKCISLVGPCTLPAVFCDAVLLSLRSLCAPTLVMYHHLQGGTDSGITVLAVPSHSSSVLLVENILATCSKPSGDICDVID